jgi:dTDP-4-dehydrorhamnose 3,5-epimerase
MHRDERGSVTEIFRQEWPASIRPCQWNVAYSEANVLRGVHVHYKHIDYLVLLRGRLSAGLYDVRPKSPTYRMSSVFEICCDDLSALRIPTGVMHGFYCHEPTIYVYGVDSYFDPNDELGCHWADPGLKLQWPCRTPKLSERDMQAGPLADVEARLRTLDPEFS